MKTPPANTERPSNVEEASEDSLASTKLALKFLYQEALRNNHFAVAAILHDTLNCCDKINFH